MRYVFLIRGVIGSGIIAAALAMSGIFFAHAQAPSGIGIKPVEFIERVDPGQVYSSVVHVTNISAVEQTYYPVVRDMDGTNEDGTPTFAKPGEKTGYEVSSWVEISLEPITVAPGQTKSVPFVIRVPEGVSPGGHYGGIFMALEPPTPETLGSAVGVELGALIKFRVSGEVVEEAQIREFKTDRNIYGSGEVKFMTRVENLGNVLVRPNGFVEIEDMFGRKVATVRISDGAKAIFPKSIRAFESTWEGGGFLFGRYQVTMSLSYGEDEKKTISSATSFWMLPLNVIVPVFGGVLLLIFGVFIAMRLYIRKKLRELGLPAQAGHPVNGRAAVSAQQAGTASPEMLYPESAPVSKLAMVTIVMLAFTLLFLVALFFFFA